jgi:hypothetical protein
VLVTVYSGKALILIIHHYHTSVNFYGTGLSIGPDLW